MKYARVNTFTNAYNSNGPIQYRYNQIMFLNYDTNPVYINNDIILQPAIVTGGVAYPTALTLSLNISEVSSERDSFNLDFRGSTTAHLVTIHTEYQEFKEDQ